MTPIPTFPEFYKAFFRVGWALWTQKQFCFLLRIDLFFFCFIQSIYLSALVTLTSFFFTPPSAQCTVFCGLDFALQQDDFSHACWFHIESLLNQRPPVGSSEYPLRIPSTFKYTFFLLDPCSFHFNFLSDESWFCPLGSEEERNWACEPEAPPHRLLQRRYRCHRRRDHPWGGWQFYYITYFMIW